MFRRIAVILAAIALMFGLAACDGQPSTADKESEIQQNGYASLSKKQPAVTMDYSPTRETIIFWAETWDEPGKLAYVYLQSADGTMLGYYVFEGLPVSYCAMLTPSYVWEDIPGDGNSTKTHVPAPGIDGAYYSGGQCDAYYGKDASTGAYIEYTAGLGINVLLYDQPLPRQDAQPLGFTSVEDVN